MWGGSAVARNPKLLELVWILGKQNWLSGVIGAFNVHAHEDDFKNVVDAENDHNGHSYVERPSVNSGRAGHESYIEGQEGYLGQSRCEGEEDPCCECGLQARSELVGSCVPDVSVPAIVIVGCHDNS
jgi:hypothetical protein